MKTWPVLLVLIVAGACGAQGFGDAAKTRSEADTFAIELDNPADGSGWRMSQLIKGDFLRQRYELAATLSTRNHCLAIKAGGEARTLVDQFDIHWCSNATPRHSAPARRALAEIQVTTQLLRNRPEPPRGTC